MKLFSRKKSKRRLDEVLRGQEPPVFPQGAMKLLQLLRDPDTPIDKVAEGMSWDPGLVLQMLKTVNSAAFGPARTIDCVKHAVTMMGRSQVEQLVLGIAVRQALPKTPARGFEADRFWQTSFFRAALASRIADRLHPADKARSFTGGLLQDMAIPLLAHARADDYGQVLEEWHGSPGAELHTLERDALGWSHGEVGAHLGVEWQLPESLTRIIDLHHGAEATDRDLPPAMRLVAVHRETERQHGVEAMVEDGHSLYGLEADWLVEAVQKCEEQAVELARALL